MEGINTEANVIMDVDPPYSSNTYDEAEINQLKANDRETTFAQINGLDANKAQRFGEALENNTVVTFLSISGSRINLSRNGNSIVSLVKYISNSESLTDVTLEDIEDEKLFELLVNAIATRVSRALCLGSINERFLCRYVLRTGIKDLTLLDFCFQNENNNRFIEQRNAELMWAFRHNKSLQKLDIICNGVDLPLRFVRAIAANACLLELGLCACKITVETLAFLLTQVKSVKRLSIKDASITRDDNTNFEQYLVQNVSKDTCLENLSLESIGNSLFCHLAYFMLKRKSLRSLCLKGCYLNKIESTKMLLSLVETTPLKILRLDDVNEFLQPLSDVVADVVALESSRLKEVNIDFHLLEHRDSDLANIMESLQQQATIDTLHLGVPDTAELRKCISYIPKLRGLRKISFGILCTNTEQADAECFKLLQDAVQRNSCLHQATIRSTNNSQKEQNQFSGFCARNQFIQKWTKSLFFEPSNVCEYVLAAACAYEAHHNEIVFNVLKGCWAMKKEHVKYTGLTLSNKRKFESVSCG